MRPRDKSGLDNTGTAYVAAVAAALVAGGVVADRLGAPIDLIATLVLALFIAAMVVAGLSRRTMRPSDYFANRRSAGAFGGSALALCALFAIAAPATPRPGVLSLQPLLAACLGALLYGAFVAAPLRRAGGLSFADVVQQRFGSRIVALVAALTGLALTLALAAHLGPLAIASLSQATGLGASASRLVVAGVAAIIVLTGGFSGALAAASTAAIALIVAWLAPAPSVLLADAAARNQLVDNVHQAFAAVEVSPAGLGLALAFAGLLAVLGPAQGLRNDAAARTGPAFAAIAAIFLAFLGLLATAAASRNAAALAGLAVDALPVTLYSDAFRGQIQICGIEPSTPDDVRRACARAGVTGPLPEAAIRIANPAGGLWIAATLGLPAAAGAAFVLAAPFVLIAAFALACHGVASIFNRDLLRRFILTRGTASGALALQRILVIGIVVAAALAPRRMIEFDERAMRLLLFAAAAVPLPLVVLGLWRRADWRAALCGMASAILAGAAVWRGHLEGELLFLAGAASGLFAGGLAALVFPSRSAGDAAGAAVMSGRAEGPLAPDHGA